MPWRAPGTAIPADPCGVAGGDQHGKRQTAGGEYYPTPNAKLGDLGSKVLAPYFSGATWAAGSVVNASWFLQVRLSDPLRSSSLQTAGRLRASSPADTTVRPGVFFLIVFLCCTSLRFQANHAGGYYFRLCPASEELTEECFQRTPVPFATNTTVIRSQSGSTTVPAVMLSKGTIPAGSTWKMNPVPECCPGASDTAPGACEARGYTCGSYQTTGSGPKCGSHQCGDDSGMGKSVPAFPWPTKDPSAPPTGVAPKFAIVDQLRIPASIKPGHYVLGWRWDCEARQLPLASF